MPARNSSTSASPAGLLATARARVDRLPPIVRATALCGITAMALAGASADWTVQRGDTLSHVSRETGASVDDLVEANDIADRDLIFPGQELVIPGSGGASKASGSSSGSSGSNSSSTATTSSSRSSRSGSRTTAVVASGDTVSSLARELGVSRDQFMTANGFTSESQLLRGSRVRASAGPPPGARTEPRVVKVRSGDTLERIADGNGLSWRRLADANDLANPNLIRAGQRLTVPGTGGTFRCPVKGGASFVNDFGVAKGNGRYHEGIDLFATRGTSMLAPVSGRVEHITGTRGGNQAHLFGDDGYRYWGTHLDSLGPTGRVSAGDVLGTVGTTGNARATSPHLHFEVYLDGRSVNTYPTLRRAC